MIKVHSLRGNRGAIIMMFAVVVLMLITAMVAMAVKLSATNLLAVGNVQTRAGAVAAADKVIGQVLSMRPGAAGFRQARQETVDINRDGVGDYTVALSAPVCIRAQAASSAAAYSVTLAGYAFEDRWNTLWEVSAVASDERTGASARVTHAVRYQMTETEKSMFCG